MKNKKVYCYEPMKVRILEDEFTEKIQNPNEVIVKNRYSHISAGTELACLAGIESWFPIPGVPGYTAIGEIVEKGENVSQEIGDHVYTFGPHAAYFKIDTTDRWHGVCVPVPAGMNEAHGSFTHMAGIAMTSIRASNIELGDFVLVTGMGAIGNLAAQMAQMQGATVIATDIEDQRLQIARDCGIGITINTTKQNLKEKIKEITDNKGITTYIDASGFAQVVYNSAENVALNGEIILLGTPRADYEANVTAFLQKFHLLPHCLTLKGALEFTYPTHPNDFVKHSIERNSAIILKLIKENKLKIGPILSHTLKPEHAQEAYDGLKNKRNEYIGVVFDWI